METKATYSPSREWLECGFGFHCSILFISELSMNIVRLSLAAGLIAWQACLPTLAEEGGQPFQQSVQITGKEKGPYSIGSNVTSTSQRVPMLDSADLPASLGRDVPEGTSLETLQGFNDFVDVMSGAYGQREKNKKIEKEIVDKIDKMQASKSKAGSEDHHGPTRASSGSKPLLTDGSVGSDLMTNTAIDTFYKMLPPDITNHLSGHSGINLSGNDPYAGYADALSRHDFQRMRELANSQAISDYNQRIAMLGLAGAEALKALSQSGNAGNFPAKDLLGKVAEDLQYAGQGLDDNNAEDAKLKMICQDIARIWQNITQNPGAANR